MQIDYQSDVLIVGAGSAGLRAAIAAREAGADVIVVEKGAVGKSGCTQNSASDSILPTRRPSTGSTS
jgi:succinate dehydrogenase/fumarate reductase flavoprotein subunit